MSKDEKPWHQHYKAGVRHEVGDMPFANLSDFVSETARKYGAKSAFTTCLPNGMNGTLSFAQVNEMSDAFARYLREVAGLTQGDRVAVQVPNSLSFPVVAFGIFKAGCVLINVNPLYTADEMAKQFEDAKPHALVIVDMFTDKIDKATRNHPIDHVIVTRVAEFFPVLPRGIVGLVQKYWDRSIPAITRPHIRLPDALAAGRADKTDVRNYSTGVTGESLAVLQYTGGTTGVAKGAMLSHANILMNMVQTRELLGSDLKEGKEVALTALPLYHIFAFTVNMLCFWHFGAQNVLIPNPRPLSALKRAFENYKITWVSGVNTLFNGLNNELWFQDSPPKHLKFSSAGGMALQVAVAERWKEITGTEIVQGYGLTETSPVLTFEPVGQARPGTIGIPIPSTEIACFSDDGQELSIGETGEIAARGPQIMMGYWNKPEETEKVMIDDWFLTGDIGFMEPDGYVRIVDRKKDMVVVSGFNVYPNEVEDVLAAHDGVLEAAVIGVPDDNAGELVKAFVVLSDPELTPESLRAYAKQHLTPYKVPKKIEVRTELPKSNVGKILRKDLRQEEQAHLAGN